MPDSTPLPSRREAIARLGGGLAAAVALLGAAREAEPPLRMSLAEWSLHRAIFSNRLDPLDFPRVAAERYGIRAVEYVSTFYAGLPRRGAWIADLRRRADDHGVRSVLIMCDNEGELGDPAASRRARAVDNHVRWLDLAQALGCHSIRVNAESSGSPAEQATLVTDGLRRLCERAASRSLNVIVENHGGLSSDANWLASVIRSVGLPNCGTLPDFGNFRVSDFDWRDRYDGVRILAPFAKGLSAKTYDFAPSGEETTIDLGRMLAIAREAGYRSFVGIEYEGRRLTEDAGIRATKSLLERCGCVS